MFFFIKNKIKNVHNENSNKVDMLILFQKNVTFKTVNLSTYNHRTILNVLNTSNIK